MKLERQLRQVLRAGEEDGGDILRKLLRTLRQLASVPEGVACRMLQMSVLGACWGTEELGWNVRSRKKLRDVR